MQKVLGMHHRNQLYMLCYRMFVKYVAQPVECILWFEIFK